MSSGAELAAPSDPQGIAGLEMFFRGGVFTQVRRVEIDGIPLTTAVVSVDESSGESTSTVTHTVALYESESSQFPGFNIQPKSGSSLTRLLIAMTGFPAVEFHEHKNFSMAYVLSGIQVKWIRRLFDAVLLDALGRNRELRINARGNRLVLYRHGMVCDPPNLKTFLYNAAALFHVFEAAAQRERSLAVPREAPDARADVERMTGPIGKRMRETLVTRAEAEDFARHPPPRTVPANIAAYADNFGTHETMKMGWLFMIGGVVFTSVFGYATYTAAPGMAGGTWGGLAIGLVFTGVGGAMGFFIGRARYRVSRLLRHGKSVAASIDAIVSTGTRINDRAMSRMMVRILIPGRSLNATCSIHGFALERAQKLAAIKKPVQILHDPTDPEQILLVDALITTDPEYD